MAKRIVNYKCPFCERRMTREKLVVHVDEEHQDVLPEDFTPFRYVFNYVNRKPVEYHGRCVECGRSTPWDENKGRYNRLCGRKQCHDDFVKKAESNNLRTLGVTRMSATPEGQMKMLAGRSISGTYKMSDGVEKIYTGSYEHDALEFLDKVMHVRSEDLECPGPVIYYNYKGKKHPYITDMYYAPYNLIIEVKDGGEHPNTRNMPEYRALQIAKEDHIIKKTDYNYLRLTGNNLSQLLAVFMDLKMQMLTDSKDRVIHVNEAGSALMGMPPVGFDSKGSVLVVNYMQNNVFSGEDINGYALADNIDLDKLITRDKTGKLKMTSGKKFLENAKYNVYLVDVTEEKKSLIAENMNEFVEEGFLYETLFDKKLYTYDQIACEEKAIPVRDYYDYMLSIKKSLTESLLYGESI